MIRPILLLLIVMPLAALAQDEEPEFEPVVDRRYACHDMYSDDSSPYIFVETFIFSVDDAPSELLEGVSEDEVAELSDALSGIRISSVTISETEFGGVAYQDGLDYRTDFGSGFENDETDFKVKYSLVIQADGDAAFYDFSDVESGEKIAPDRLLSCKKIQ